MCKFVISGLLTAVLSLGATDRSNGQLIRIFDSAGNVNIRVPFVRVQVDPVYGTYVRAPFVRVNSPPPYYYPPQYYAQPQPGSFAPGYAPNGMPVSPSRQPRVTPRGAETSPAITGPESNRVSNPPDPPGLHSVLSPEPANPLTLDQLRRALGASSRALNGQLSRYSNAEEWQKYLRPPEFILDESQNQDVAASVSDVATLQKLLERFDRASVRPDYHLVTKLEGFQTTHQNLRSMVKMLGDIATEKMEELPAPATDKRQ